MCVTFVQMDRYDLCVCMFNICGIWHDVVFMGRGRFCSPELDVRRFSRLIAESSIEALFGHSRRQSRRKTEYQSRAF